MIKVYGFSASGNCYKIKLLLTLLNKDFEWVEINSLKGETRTEEFLTKNINGKVPLLELENGDFLPESSAILFYLSKNTTFLPNDDFKEAQVLQWMFFEQYSHQPYIAINRKMKRLGQKEEFLDKFEENKVNAYKALEVMEKHLSDKTFFVDNTYTIADIALFAYTHVAEAGEFELSKYPNILSWIERIKAYKNHITLV